MLCLTCWQHWLHQPCCFLLSLMHYTSASWCLCVAQCFPPPADVCLLLILFHLKGLPLLTHCSFFSVKSLSPLTFFIKFVIEGFFCSVLSLFLFQLESIPHSLDAGLFLNVSHFHLCHLFLLYLEHLPVINHGTIFSIRGLLLHAMFSPILAEHFSFFFHVLLFQLESSLILCMTDTSWVKASLVMGFTFLFYLEAAPLLTHSIFFCIKGLLSPLIPWSSFFNSFLSFSMNSFLYWKVVLVSAI